MPTTKAPPKRTTTGAAPRPESVRAKYPDIDPRIRERRIRVRRSQGRRRLKLVAVVSLPVVLAGGAFGVLNSPLMQVRDVEVSGLDPLSKAVALHALGEHRGESLYRVDASQVRRTVGRLPGVTKVRVRRVWPSTLGVNVVRNRAVARLGVGEVAVGVSIDGLVLGSAESGDLVVLDPGSATLNTGDRLPRRLRSAAETAAHLSPQLRRVVSAVGVDADDRVVLGLGTGGRVILGDLELLSEKLAATETMVSGRVDLRCLATIDVRVPDRPIITRDSGCGGGGA